MEYSTGARLIHVVWPPRYSFAKHRLRRANSLVAWADRDPLGGREVPEIIDLVASAQARIRNGLPAYAAIQALHKDPADAAAKSTLAAHGGDLGYALLLKRYAPNVVDATDAEIAQAAFDTVPAVATLFWSFRVMVGIGMALIALFALAFWLAARRRLERYRWFLWLAAFSLPLPWISSELGWIVAEYGRQPWAIEGVLPTFLANSSVAAANIWFSLIGFVAFLYGAGDR